MKCAQFRQKKRRNWKALDAADETGNAVLSPSSMGKNFIYQFSTHQCLLFTFIKCLLYYFVFGLFHLALAGHFMLNTVLGVGPRMGFFFYLKNKNET